MVRKRTAVAGNAVFGRRGRTVVSVGGRSALRQRFPGKGPDEDAASRPAQSCRDGGAFFGVCAWGGADSLLDSQDAEPAGMGMVDHSVSGDRRNPGYLRLWQDPPGDRKSVV